MYTDSKMPDARYGSFNQNNGGDNNLPNRTAANTFNTMSSFQNTSSAFGSTFLSH